MAAPGATDGKERCILRLEVGHESWMLSSPAPSCSHPLTHRWKVYVRGINFVLDETLVEKVVFQLHEDFESARRVVTSPPYEVSETGYAGFSIPIYLSFVNYKREFCLEYDMNLRYVSQDKTKVIKTLEFKDPKPELRAKLIKAGADVITARLKPSLPTATSFQKLFGETLRLVPSEKKSSKNHVPRKDKSGCSTNYVKAADTSKESTGSLKEKKGSSAAAKPSQSSIGSKTKSSKSSEDLHGFQAHGEKKKAPFADGNSHASPGVVSPASTANQHQTSDGTVAECSSKNCSCSGSSGRNSSHQNCSKSLDRDPSDVAVNQYRKTDSGGTVERAKAGSGKGKRKPKDAVVGSGGSPVHVRQKRRSDSGLESDLSSATNVQDCSPYQCSANCIFSPCSAHSQDSNPRVSPAASDSSQASSHQRNVNANGDGLRYSCTESTTSPPPEKTKKYDDLQKCRNIDLLTDLQRRIMTESDRTVVQQIADLISHRSNFEVRQPFLEFDLCCLKNDVIEQLLLCFEKS